MTAICIIDTTIFCNILGVPKKSQDKEATQNELRFLLNKGTSLLLPMAVIYETGNHIAQNGDGRIRRQTAELFVNQVRDAILGEAPWSVTPMQDTTQIESWLSEFPDWAMTETGFADLSIIKIFEQQCELHLARRVFIWSYDKHLKSYDRPAKI